MVLEPSLWHFESIRDYLLINNDPDLVLIDFEAYVKAWEEILSPMQTIVVGMLVRLTQQILVFSDRTIRSIRKILRKNLRLGSIVVRR